MTRPCSGCGLHSCDGRCYLEDAPDTCCDVPFVDGVCPECRSIKLTELWRRQDMDEMLTAQVERDLRFAMRKDKAA